MPTPGHLALTREIDELRRHFERLADDADALVAGLTDDQFAWKPASAPSALRRGRAAEGWSIAQCNAIRQGLYGAGPFVYWWFARMFVRMLEPPPRLRVKTPALFQPPAERPRREIMAAFRAYQVQYIDRLRQANGLDLSRARVRSPAASWIFLPLGSGFAAMIAHERRHLWQAKQVMQAPGFPRS